jgi:hypothetical protein
MEDRYYRQFTSLSVAVQSELRKCKVPPFIRHAKISHAPAHRVSQGVSAKTAHLPMSKAMLSTWATLEPMLILSRAGSDSKTFVTFPCETSTPFGLPVLPVLTVNTRQLGAKQKLT